MNDAAATEDAVFSSHGLFFREWRPDDAEAMVALFDTDQMNRWTPLASPFTVQVAAGYVGRASEARAAGTLQLAISLAPGTTPVGEVIVFPSGAADEVELAYAVGAEHQGRGVGTRAVLAALDLARSRGARRAVLTIAEGNHASAAVACAAGFRKTDAQVQDRQRKGFVLHMRTWAREL